MKRFVEGEDRRQGVLLPEYLDDFVAEENQVRVIEAFVDELDLRGLGFEGVVPEATGRPAYHPTTMLKIYLYGYLNRIQSSRRLERETQRNIELMWLTLFGHARDVLANIAKTKNASVSYQNEQVTIVPKGGSAPGGAIVLNSTTGMIGMPSQSIGGIFARCLERAALGSNRSGIPESARF